MDLEPLGDARHKLQPQAPLAGFVTDIPAAHTGARIRVDLAHDHTRRQIQVQRGQGALLHGDSENAMQPTPCGAEAPQICFLDAPIGAFAILAGSPTQVRGCRSPQVRLQAEAAICAERLLRPARDAGNGMQVGHVFLNVKLYLVLREARYAEAQLVDPAGSRLAGYAKLDHERVPAPSLNPDVVAGLPGQRGRVLDWPYTEGLRLDEAMHPLTLLVTGVYGRDLPNQNGAPLRLIVPWKYGFKGIKSIVRITLTDEQPRTAWNALQPREYGFYANVNPQVDHPRWSQATERRIGEFFKRRTLPFNGYAEQVAQLYSGMDLRKHY